MLRLLLLPCLLLSGFFSLAKTIVVKNADELKAANNSAVPGDVVVLRNGVWNNIKIALSCNGTKEKPITFAVETAGKVLITGNSTLRLGGSYIIVDGLYFSNGFAGNNAVITFCIDKKTVANNCRVTNTVIDDFNNPRRLDENYWVAFYGKNNRIDHCSFQNKKNIGVLLAVILDDDRSRENFHSIDHNYFGKRLPLASNGGEIIRVGVSQHCEFNSNTQITNNFFEHCDGEGEIISIKSGSNIIRNNLFKECQGAVVLRHGNYNTVENNIFMGNNKAGTGGVRIINKGQWVVNNLFYQCKGEGFRSPLTIMNGVPNSPANRYLEVTDAVIANNSFYESAPISLCEGSDPERSVAPKQVAFINNIFYNSKGGLVYNVYDDIKGFHFNGNLISAAYNQHVVKGFSQATLTAQKVNTASIPKLVGTNPKAVVSDSLLQASKSRLVAPLQAGFGFSNEQLFVSIQKNATTQCGAKWFANQASGKANKITKADCKTGEEISTQIANNKGNALYINLTGSSYSFTEPIVVNSDVFITSKSTQPILFSTTSTAADFTFLVQAGNKFGMSNLMLDLSGIESRSFISTDTSGSSNHSNFTFKNCTISNLKSTFFNAAKSSVTDSIVISKNTFSKNNGLLFSFSAENDNKGFYNVEKLHITGNSFTDNNGQILSMLRGGNDESTMGPQLNFSNNVITNCNTTKDEPLIYLYGTQFSVIEKNQFINSNTATTVLQFADAVRAQHFFRHNTFTNAGKVIVNKFVMEKSNTIR